MEASMDSAAGERHGCLDGKRAVITGAASGIGRAAASRFSTEGASVAVWDLDSAGAEAVAAD